MQIDKKMLDRLLMMNDEQLGDLIGKIASESGIDPSTLGLNANSIANIRQALGSATDADLQQLNDVYDAYKQSQRSK